MPRNDFRKTAVLRLPDRARLLCDAAREDPAHWGLTPETILEIGQAADRLAADNERVFACEAALRAAVDERGRAYDDCAARLASAANRAYATPGLKPSDLSALGLSPREAARATVRPKTPTLLVAAPLPNGAIRIGFARNGNAEGTIFVVEASADGREWRTAAVGTRTRYVLAGFPVGVPVLFRVVALRGGVAALPSGTANAYGAVVSRVAA